MLRIGELAELAGTTTRTIRHYHHIGLLPEPERTGSGYRSYELADVARLLRIRRLTALGLSLEEVADALDGPGGPDLREILHELDADLAEQETRLRRRRAVLAELLAAEGDLTLSPRIAELLRQASTLGAHPRTVAREADLLEVFEGFPGGAGPLLSIYDDALADHDLAAGMATFTHEFKALADAAPDDPRIESLSEQLAGFITPMTAQLPADGAEPRPEDDPDRYALLERVLTSGMSPAQQRLLQRAGGV